MGYKKTFRYSTGNPIVDEVGTMNFTGNVIPMVWFKTIRYPMVRRIIMRSTFWLISYIGIDQKKNGMRKVDS